MGPQQVQAEKARQRRQRGRERRVVQLPEPVLYERHQLSISEPDGSAHIAHRCPVALTAPGSMPCHIVRQGMRTKHGVVGQGFPVAVSGVTKLHCCAHQLNFDMLHPLVYQNLPASVSIRPELVVLTEDLVLIYEAYEDLAVQATSNPYIPICSHNACFECLWVLSQAVSGVVMLQEPSIYIRLCAGAGQRQHRGSGDPLPSALQDCT